MQNDAAKVRMAFFDFDGVFTDNHVYVDQDGKESVRCWRSDGIGISRLRGLGVESIVISTEVNPVVQKRCAKLGIECISGCRDKLGALKDALAKRGVPAENACFVGNDVPDLACMGHVGFPVAVKGSYPEVLKAAKYVTNAEGGRGAVREVCDLIYYSKKG